jgi:TonB family protein
VYLYKNVPPPKSLEEKISQITTRFVLDEKPAEVLRHVKEKKKDDLPKPKPADIPEEPIDLTQKPLLNQPQNEVTPPQTPQEQPKVIRRVYGLKKVYSTGIGSGGSASDAVIGKIGNTLNTEIDTFSATKEELKGTLVSVTTVTALPKIKSIVKPEYTKEMNENKVEGTIKVRVQVDIDGKVKKAVVLNDLGFGTKEKVLEACLKLEFEPASINGVPCAVWIIVPFTFRMLN